MSRELKRYFPLPRHLIIGESNIHGQGVFVREGAWIEPNEWIGISHYRINLSVGQDSLLIRTPLGGFINEDKDDPNCTKRIVNESGLSTYYLVALRHIEGGEELTLKYDLSKSD